MIQIYENNTNDNLEGKQAILPSVVDNALNNPSVCFFTGKGKGEKPNLYSVMIKILILLKLTRTYRKFFRICCFVSLECHLTNGVSFQIHYTEYHKHNSESANYYKLVHRGVLNAPSQQ